MGNSPYSTLILIALMVVAFYFLIIRPQKKRQQAQVATMSSLTAGTRVLLTSGVFGTLVEVGDKQALLELAPGLHVTVLKQAIARAVRPGDEDEYSDDDDVESAPLTGGTLAGGAPSDTSPGADTTLSADPVDTDPDQRPGTSTTPLRD